MYMNNNKTIKFSNNNKIIKNHGKIIKIQKKESKTRNIKVKK